MIAGVIHIQLTELLFHLAPLLLTQRQVVQAVVQALSWATLWLSPMHTLN